MESIFTSSKNDFYNTFILGLWYNVKLENIFTFIKYKKIGKYIYLIYWRVFTPYILY